MAIDVSDAPPAPHQRRPKQTRRSVLIIDKAADITIKVGGIGVIIAVFGIMLFLAEVVVPLFQGGEATGRVENALPPPSGRNLMSVTDEYKTVGVVIEDSGRLKVFHLTSGTPIAAPAFDFGTSTVTAFARTSTDRNVAFGFDDGSVRFGTLDIEMQVLSASQVPANLKSLGGRDRTDGNAVYSEISSDQFRRIAVSVKLDEPQSVAKNQAIVGLHYGIGGTVERSTKAFVTVDSAGTLRLSRTEARKNLMTGDERTVVMSAQLPNLPKGAAVGRILMTEKADQVYVADAEGLIYRYDTRNFDKPVMAEILDAFPGKDGLTAFGFLLGEQSIVVGGSNGAVDIYFRLQQANAKGSDGYGLVRAHRLEPHAAPVVLIGASQRGKMLVTGDAQGNVWVRHATSEQTLLKLQSNAATKAAFETVTLTPRDDGVLAVGANRFTNWDMSVPHPETTLRTIFGKVWYEGYSEPTYTWQSSAGTDSFEPKLSLIPLIFGTIKATLYSLLFAVPVALLGAIYTSEFVHHRVRATVKPVMEMMASLPSVVLGFIAALILAPIVETWIAAVLFAFVALPLALLLAAYAWQFLPDTTAFRLQGLPKFTLMFMVIAAAVFVCYAVGPLFEQVFFYGDFKHWLNGDVGSGVPFYFLLLLPATFAVVSVTATRLSGDAVREKLRSLPRLGAAALDLGRWLAMLAAASALSYAMAMLFHSLGMDPRGGLVDTYVQRNTLVVGFAMGFAVIPIIYTIAEDALNAVPEHLRAASLACGATPWQSSIYVILPTSVSGVFAAMMVGMGRAVGETMIVVMAAGNTPILDWNIFNGLRALSANIAVELPEAVKDGTLYRMLFLTAMTLFVMTFVVNTLAELVRQRFRKRAAQL